MRSRFTSRIFDASSDRATGQPTNVTPTTWARCSRPFQTAIQPADGSDGGGRARRTSTAQTGSDRSATGSDRQARTRSVQAADGPFKDSHAIEFSKDLHAGPGPVGKHLRDLRVLTFAACVEHEVVPPSLGDLDPTFASTPRTRGIRTQDIFQLNTFRSDVLVWNVGHMAKCEADGGPHRSDNVWPEPYSPAGGTV